MEQENFRGEWVAMAGPFAEILDKTKLENPPPMKMTVLEAIYCQMLVHAIECAQARNLTEPTAIAAFITGYLSSMGAMPKAAPATQ